MLSKSYIYFLRNGVRKLNTSAKMKNSKYCKKGVVSCKNMWKMVWLNNRNNPFEMFRKIASFEFLEKDAWRRPLVPRCAACSLGSYWRPTLSQVSRELSEIGDNADTTRWATVISCLLSYRVHCALIPHQYK